MPVVGFGTSRTTDPEREVEMALNAGYRHFDCATVGLRLDLLISNLHCNTKYPRDMPSEPLLGPTNNQLIPRIDKTLQTIKNN